MNEDPKIILTPDEQRLKNERDQRKEILGDTRTRRGTVPKYVKGAARRLILKVNHDAQYLGKGVQRSIYISAGVARELDALAGNSTSFNNIVNEALTLYLKARRDAVAAALDRIERKP